MYSPYAKASLSVKTPKLNKSSPFYSPIRRSITPRSSRNASFNSTFMDSVLDENADRLIESYGPALPVLIIEAITVADKTTDISVKLEPFGYASLVCGRQLFIWKYKQDNDRSVVHCKELTLPPSDLAHKAELVHLFQTEDSKLPSALAVSPEGHVRYWPNINHEGSSVDAQPDLQGQECCSLTSIFPLGCVLATTSSSLVILTPTIGDGQPNVICRSLTLPLGMLAGIGSKVSSFIFGSVPTQYQTSETKQLMRVLSSPTLGDYYLFVLSVHSLQKWLISKRKKENSDKLLFEVDLEDKLGSLFVQEAEEPWGVAGIKVWCLDMQLFSQNRVMILAAGVVSARANENMHYAFVTLDVTGDEDPIKSINFYYSKYSEPFESKTEERLINYKLLLPSPDSSTAYMYNSDKAMCFQYPLPQVDHSELNLSNSEDVILGAGSCDGVPLFFIKFYGTVSFLPGKKVLGDTRLLGAMKDVTIRQADPTESPEGFAAQLRTAMCLYCTGDMDACDALTYKLVGGCRAPEPGILDDAVISLSLGIIDDYPVSDPRWCESLPTGSVSSSLIISYQLDDKLKAHEYLLNFLKAFELFEKLTISKVGDFRIPTNVLLCEHAEKIVSAKALRRFLNDHSDIIENAIRDTLDRLNKVVKNHLTPQDVFFREVSAFHTIFSSILDWEMAQLNADESLANSLSSIMAVNKIFVGLLETIVQYRQNKKEAYCLQSMDVGGEFMPWTAREGNSGIRMHLRNKLHINSTHALSITGNIQIQSVLYQQYVTILDFYLDSYRLQLESLKPEQRITLKKEFEKERNCFIKPLLVIQQYERAASIAEKYLDFDLLIQICEETKNADRLQRYMHQFSEHNFSEFVFKWYLDKGQKGKIFDKNLGQRDVLGQFLQDHESLKWIYFIQDEKYEAAHVSLKQLALKEIEFLNRKKTLLSLSKLCAMISDVPQSTKSIQIEAINLEQDLITHQETLAISVVEACGIDPRNMRVFPPEELIEMYIAEENSTANAYDFKIALDLLNFIKKPSDDPDICLLRLRIWSKAILRDTWEALDTNNPLDSIKETIFFQVIELAFDQGIDIQEFMPPMMELLQAPELNDLADNTNFRFLLKAGYEHILRIIV